MTQTVKTDITVLQKLLQKWTDIFSITVFVEKLTLSHLYTHFNASAADDS